MGPLPGLIAHGGVAGAVVESLVALAVLAVLLAVWHRERRGSSNDRGPARLRDEDEPPPS